MFDMNLQFAINKIKALKSYISWWKKLRLQKGKCAYFFGIPTHTNIGDSAIVVAESCFLKRCGYNSIIEITSQEYVYNRKCIRRLLPRRATIFLPGGGNMGSLWPVEEERRCQIIEDFKNHPIVIFPQTIYYGNQKGDEDLKNHTKQIYNLAAHMTIVARENVSFGIMKVLYPKCNILLSPDIVLSMGHQSFRQDREGVLLCFRNDKEKNMSSEAQQAFKIFLIQAGYSLRSTDTMADRQIVAANRTEIVTDKMREIASARLLITDRLHGMVFAAITGTPCIVLANNHHKVSGTYEWLKKLDYITFVSDMDEAKEKVSRLYQMSQNVFEIDQECFAKLRNCVRQSLN